VGASPPWAPWTPDEVAEHLAGVATRWYVVAGWALDLFRGEQSRPHEDIEIGVPQGGFPAIRSALADLPCDVIGDGQRWPLEGPAFDAHFQTWFRDPTTGVYVLDVFRDPHVGDTWVCRRDPAITLPYDDVVMSSSAGIPFLAPQVALLFKAKRLRDKDRADFDGVRPLLSAAQVRWLAGALARVHPGHPWLADLGG
jgi:hypothetical protein